MPEKPEPNSKGFRLSIRRALGLVVAFAIGLTPMAYFGWQGIISTFFVTIAGLLFVFRKHSSAASVILLLLIGQFLIYPFLDGARGSILREECANNIRTITIAIHEYEAKHGRIPPPYTTDENGKRLHSWRVLLLPHLGEKKLYDQIDKSKPWDDPVNVPFHSQMPDVYCCAAVKYYSKWRTTGDTTSFVVVIDDHTPWHVNGPQSISQIPDGSYRTIAIVESEPHRIPWMSPNDPTFESFINSVDCSEPHGRNTNCSTFDTSTQVMSNEFGLNEIAEWLIMDDGK